MVHSLDSAEEREIRLRSAVLSCSRRSAALAVVVLVAACGAKGPPPPPPPPQPVPRVLSVDVHAAPTLNPDARNRATPLVIRVYELRAPQTFLAADFFALFDKDQSALGNDLASREELQLRPGETLKLAPRELKADVRAVGVFAAFRDLERAQWRAVVALPAAPPPTTTPPAKPVPVSVRVTLGTRDVRADVQ